MQLLRVLLPSWRFFDDVTPLPELWLERENGWTRCPLRPDRARTWGNLLLNAEENYDLAARALLTQLLEDLEHGRDAKVSRALVTALAAREAGADPVRFRITVEGKERFNSSSTAAACPS